MLTDASIRAALREIKKGEKTAITLTDKAPKGAGRLTLVVKPNRAEWYSAKYVLGAKRMEKLGAFPDMTLAQARAKFADPNAGQEEVAKPEATVGEMFDGYLESMRQAGKPAVKQVEKILAVARKSIGASKLAAEVTPDDIVAVIKPVYDRGSRVQADKFRMYIGAAFRWAMKATHDYRVENARDWGIKTNPIEAVARDTEAEGVGNRWLSELEYKQLLNSLASFGRRRTKVREAVEVLMLTGQRVREILQLKAHQWNSAERLLIWEKTKNGKPHVLPVCKRAAAILDGLKPSSEGWLFPSEKKGQHQPDGALLVWLKRYAAERGMAPFNGRDLRRTWKTLAGAAGLTKVERDLLQNHTEGDVSSRHYDRYEYLTEKRQAVAKWEAWLQQKVSADKADRKADHVVDRDQHANL